MELRIREVETGAMVEIQTKDEGRLWGPVQLLRLEVYHRALKRVTTAENWRVVHIENLASGFHISIEDAEHGIEAGVWLRHIDQRGL